MAIQPEQQAPINPTPSTAAAVQAVIPDKNVKPDKKKSSYTIMIALLVILIMFVAGAGYYFLVVKGNTDQSSAVDPQNLTNEEFVYESKDYNFSLVLKKEWNVNELGKKIIIYTGNDATMNFEAFTGEEFSAIEQVDEPFCDSFETGFKEGLEDSGLADQFDFVLFEQNGIKGCSAEGQIIEGYKQKYNVFFDPVNKQVYSIFYTVPADIDTAEMDKAFSSFSLNAQ